MCGGPLAIAIAFVWVLGCACSAGPIDVAGLVPSSLRDNVVAHWPLDDGAGTRALDRSRLDLMGYNGSVSGGTWIPEGRFKGALHFELGTEIVVPSFLQATPAWSVALWVRPPLEDFGTDFVTLISTEVTFERGVRQGGGWQMNLRMNLAAGTTPQYQFGYWLGPAAGDYNVYNCQCVVPDQWTHLAAVIDSAAGTLSFYANGVFQGIGNYLAGSAMNQPVKQGTSSLYMGRWETPGTRLFKGDLDDIVIYSRALKQYEVVGLATAPAPDPR